MPHTLSEIVSAALRQADAGVKVASLRDAPIEDRSFVRVDDYLARELGQAETSPATTKQASVARAAPRGVGAGVDDIRFAMKLAEALEHGAHLVEKLALEGPLNKSTGGAPRSGPTPPGGPAPIQPHNFDRAVTATPVPQASAHARAAQANDTLEPSGNPETDRDMQLNDGPVIPANYPNSATRTTGKTTKHASRQQTERLLKSKIAQHRMLVSLGQVEAANAVLKEAEDLQQSASLIFNDHYESSRFPDNLAVRDLTKAQARDRNQREAGSYFNEPVKRDSAATTHLAVTDGLKLSSTSLARMPIHRALRNKESARSEEVPAHRPVSFREAMARSNSDLRANVPYMTMNSGLGGGVLGGALAHGLTGGSGAATALGAGIGALGFGALGYHGAKGEQELRQRMREEGMRRSKKASLARQKIATTPIVNPGLVGKAMGKINKGFTAVGDHAIDMVAGEKGLASVMDPAQRLSMGRKVVGTGAGLAAGGLMLGSMGGGR